MDSVIRALVVYFFLLILFRISGRRTLSDTTTFDLVMLLIISETTQEAMVDDDHSITNGFLLIMTLIGATVGLSLLKQRWRIFEKWLEGIPLVVIENGELRRDRMDKVRVDERDIMFAARQLHGLERLDQIKYAIVEVSGEISIVPKPSATSQ